MYSTVCVYIIVCVQCRPYNVYTVQYGPRLAHIKDQYRCNLYLLPICHMCSRARFRINKYTQTQTHRLSICVCVGRGRSVYDYNV